MSGPTLSPERIVAAVEEAARPIPVLWPLSSAVAASPFWDLHHVPFDHALARGRELLGISGVPSPGLLTEAFRAGRITASDLSAALLEAEDEPAAASSRLTASDIAAPLTVLGTHDQATGGSLGVLVDREVARYCAAYLGRLLPSGRDGSSGFFAHWVAAVADDPVARRLGVADSPIDHGSPEEVVARALERLGVSDSDAAVGELGAQLARLPGWAAHAKWRSRWASPDAAGPSLLLIDLLAVRLCYDLAAITKAGHRPDAVCCRPGSGRRPPVPSVPAPGIVGGALGERLAEMEPGQAASVWLSAYERHYRDGLLGALDREVAQRPSTAPPRAQLVCCIDVRSEGLRRHLEKLGDYETLGFAGFFGIPARVWPLGGDEPLDLCPVLLRPTVEVFERHSGDTTDDRELARSRQFLGIRQSLLAMPKTAVTPFLMAEAAGVGLGPLAVLRTSAPTFFARLRRAFSDRMAPFSVPEPVLEGPDAPSDQEQALYAETALRTMGLTDRFAPVVVLCGHGSTTENNPFASALDCGACGAARGGRSARLAAAVLNRSAVRRELAERGIAIGERTVFVAAEHDTATDTVTAHIPGGLDPASQAAVDGVVADLRRAGEALAAERAARLPGPGQPPVHRRRNAGRRLAARSADWAQVQPEWGLARCAAFIAGPRSITAGVDLEQRVFLHSYEPEADVDGTALETILTGPMVVAHWISAAYYHSTVDPEILGAGDKVAHNIVAGIGVVQGAGGDLKLGLPRQAVFLEDRAYHEPMRLLVVLVAPPARIDAVIARNPVVADLVRGQWIHVVAGQPGRFWLRAPNGGWRSWQNDPKCETEDTERV